MLRVNIFYDNCSTTKISLCYLGDPNSLIINMDIPDLSSLFIFYSDVVDFDFFLSVFSVKPSWVEQIINLRFSSREYLAGTINWIRLNALISCKGYVFTSHSRVKLNVVLLFKRKHFGEIPLSIHQQRQIYKWLKHPPPPAQKIT